MTSEELRKLSEAAAFAGPDHHETAWKQYEDALIGGHQDGTLIHRDGPEVAALVAEAEARGRREALDEAAVLAGPDHHETAWGQYQEAIVGGHQDGVLIHRALKETPDDR